MIQWLEEGNNSLTSSGQLKQGSFTHKRTSHLFEDGKKIPEWLGWYKYPNRIEIQNMFEDHLSNECYCAKISTTYCIWKILIHCKTALFYKSFGSACKPCTKKTFTREIEQNVLLWAINHSFKRNISCITSCFPSQKPSLLMSNTLLFKQRSHSSRYWLHSIKL